MSGYSWNDFKRDARDPLFVGFVFLGLMILLGLVWTVGWSFVFAMMLGFLIFDWALGLFVRRRKIPFSENPNQFKFKGWVFGAFLLGIAVATIVSTLFSQTVSDFLADPTLSFQTRILLVSLANLLVTVLLWAYFDQEIWFA